MIILNKFIDLMKVIRIETKAKCLSTDSAKSCALSAFVLATLFACTRLDNCADPLA